jgi:hypothetical protein
MLAMNGKLLLRHPDLHGGLWFISCVTAVGACLLGLLVEPVIVKGRTYFKIAKVDNFYWLPILDARDWECQMLAWKAPLAIRLATGFWPQGGCSLIEPAGQKDTLLRVAALNGFWRIPKTGLVQLGRDLGAAVNGKDDFCTILLEVAETSMGRDLTDEEKLSILRARLPKYNEAKDVLTGEDCHDLLGADEAKKVQTKQEEEAKQAPVFDEVKVAARALAKKVHDKGKAAGARASKGDKHGPPLKKPRKYPPRMGFDSDLTVDYLDTFLPMGCKFGVDKLDQNWRLRAYGHTLGRSWALHGIEGAANALIKEAWRQAPEGGYEQVCPFPDLLK